MLYSPRCRLSFSRTQYELYLNNVLALASFIMGVNVALDSEAHKAHPSIIKVIQYGSRILAIPVCNRRPNVYEHGEWHSSIISEITTVIMCFLMQFGVMS